MHINIISSFFYIRPGAMMLATSGTSFKGVQLERNERNEKAFKASEGSLLRTIRETLTKRFEDRSAGVVTATKVASFKNWPEKAAAGLFSVRASSF